MLFLVSDGFTVKQTLRWSSTCRAFVRDGSWACRSEGLGRGRSWMIIQTLWTLWRALEVGWIFNVVPSWGEVDAPLDRWMLNMRGKRWALNTVVFFSWGNPQRELMRMVIFLQHSTSRGDKSSFLKGIWHHDPISLYNVLVSLKTNKVLQDA